MSEAIRTNRKVQSMKLLKIMAIPRFSQVVHKVRAAPLFCQVLENSALVPPRHHSVIVDLARLQIRREQHVGNL